MGDFTMTEAEKAALRAAPVGSTLNSATGVVTSPTGTVVAKIAPTAPQPAPAPTSTSQNVHVEAVGGSTEPVYVLNPTVAGRTGTLQGTTGVVSPLPTKPVATTDKSTGIKVVSVGGELVAPKIVDLVNAGVPNGSQVTASVDQVKVVTPTGETTVYKPPTQQEIAEVEKTVATFEQKQKELNNDINAYNANPVNKQTQEVLQNRQIALDKEATTIRQTVSKYNIGLSTIPSSSTSYETPPTIKKPAGLSQSLWWGFTPWKEESGETVRTYTQHHGYLGLTGGIAKNVGLMAAPAIGIAAMSMVAPPLGVAASAALGGYMAYQTQKGWSQMTNAERGFNVAMTALCFVPAATAGARGLRNASIGEYRVQGKQLAQAERVATKDMVSAIERNYGSQTAKAYESMSRTQAKLVEQYIKIATLEQRKGFTAMLEEKIGLKYHWDAKATSAYEYDLARLRTKAAVLEVELKAKASVVSRELNMKAGFDNPRLNPDTAPFVKSAAELRKMSDSQFEAYFKGRGDYPEIESAKRIIDSLPEDIVRNSRSVAESITAKYDIKTLRLEAERANAALKAAQNKYGADQTKWSDLAYKAAVAQNKYDVARLGTPSKLLAELQEINEAIEAKMLKNGKPLSDKQIVKLQVVADELGAKYAKSVFSNDMRVSLKAIRNADGEIIGYEVPKEVTRGRGGVAVAEKPKGITRLTGGGRGVRLRTKPMFLPAALATIGVSQLRTVTRNRPTVEYPMALPATVEITRQQITEIVGPNVTPAIISEIKTVIDTVTSDETDTDITNKIDDVVDEETKPETKERIQSKVPILTKLAIQVRDYKEYKEETKPRMPIHLGTVKIGNEIVKREDLKGSMSFQQGFLLKDGKKQPVVRVFLRGRSTPIVNIGKVPGVPIAKPQQSLTQRGKGLESAKVRDIGAFHVYVPKTRHGRLVYKKDKVGTPRISKVR